MKKITLFFLMMFLTFASFAQLPEGFEGTSLPNLATGDWVLPSGTWKVINENISTGPSAQTWGIIGVASSCVGTRSAYLNRENVVDGTFAVDWLVMPQTTIPNNGQLRFLSKLTQASNQGSVYTIRVSTTSQTDINSFTTIQTWTETEINAVFNECEEKVVQFPAAYINQPVYVAFVMTNDNGDRWIIDEVNIVEQCLDPTNLGATPTATTANLTWTGNGASYEIEHLVGAGATPTGVATGTSTTNSFTQTGLTANTQYCYYVRSTCTSGTTSYMSEWSGPFCYTTTLAPVGCGGNFTDPGGATGQYANNANVSTLICPDNNTDLVTVTFTAFNLENNWDFLRVYAGTSAAAPLIATYTGTAIPPAVTSAAPGACLFFVFTSDGSGTRDGWIANIACAPAPSCSKPINVTTTTVLPTSVTLNWTQPANPDASIATEWQYLRLPCGSPVPNATTTGWVSAPTNPFTVSGLNPDTCYTFYVRAVCSPTSTSAWSVGINATTPVIPPACGGTFTDPGGSTGNYPNNANVSTLICPDNNTDLVTVTFTAFNLENNFDNLRVYAGNNALAPLIATYTGTAIPPAVTSAAPGACLFFVFTSDGSVQRAGWIANVTCAPAPTCSKPTNVVASNVLSTSATLTWTQPANPGGGTATQWQVLALPCGSALPNATTTGWFNAPTNPFTLPGLTPDTCYTFYVRAVCSPTDSSTWSTGVNANTQQVPPACGGTFTDTGGANGNYANNANITTTICPDVTGNVVIVNFASFQLENNYDNLSIYDGSTIGAPLLGTYTGNNMPPQFIATLANGGCLTFRFTSDGSVTNPGWVANIICAPPPTCPQPNTLAIVSTTSTSATVSWNETGTSSNWNIVVQPVGSGYPNGASTVIPTLGANPFTIQNLTPSTQYEFYVQSDCGGGDISFWSGPRPFNTLFGGCAGNAAAGDACVTATPICNLNGYCGNTSATYSDASWPQMDTAFCGSIENNSFLTFIATATSISFQVNVANCTNNNGIQMMIFSAANCGSGPVTSLTCWSPGNVPNGPTTVTANGLVVGNTYYLMIDGFAGDVCDYSITAPGGTQNSVEITPATATVCLGSSINLVASGGNGTFIWSPSTDLNTTTGATVIYTPSAVGTYTITVDSTDPNTACSSTDTTTITVIAPITPTFDPIGTLCIGDTFVLPTTSLEGVTGLWSPAIDNTTTTTYTFAPTAGQCAVTTTMEVIISASADPLFTAIAPICTTDTAPTLSTSSDNGIVGTWNPATIDMSIIGTTPYVFTPNASCGTTFTLDVTIIDSTVPTFDPIANICQDQIAPSLPVSSTNTTPITGTWNPATIDSSTPGLVTYTFTPDAGQCATTTTLDVTIDIPSIVVTFDPIANICQDQAVPSLPATSLEGVSGTWSPATIDSSVIGTVTYNFNPNSGQCATNSTIDVTIDAPSIVPTFDPIANICQDQTAPSLPVSSTNTTPITGTWNPATIDSSTLGLVTYTFTPDAGQCATTTTLDVTIDAPSIVVTFNPIANICQDQAVPSLPATSLEGVSGTWSPATIDSSVVGTVIYNFNPNSGQCATTSTLSVTIDAPSIVPTFNPIANICQNQTAPSLPVSSTNATPITGTWNPAAIDTSSPGTATYTFTPDAGQCAVTPPDLTITVVASPSADIIPSTSVCSGSVYTFPVLTSGGYYSDSGATGTQYSVGQEITINSTQTFYVYASSGTAPNTCTDEKSFTVTVVDAPVVTLTGGCLNNTYTIEASVSGGQAVNYTWYNSSDVVISGETGSTLVVTQDGMYSCMVTLASGTACSSSKVGFDANGTVCTIQKGISPNGDGSNDNFDLTGLNVKKLEIFNRYGKKVYSFSNYTNQWYGQSDSGNELPTGTYYFVIERDKVSTETGWIYINR